MLLIHIFCLKLWSIYHSFSLVREVDFHLRCLYRRIGFTQRNRRVSLGWRGQRGNFIMAVTRHDACCYKESYWAKAVRHYYHYWLKIWESFLCNHHNGSNLTYVGCRARHVHHPVISSSTRRPNRVHRFDCLEWLQRGDGCDSTPEYPYSVHQQQCDSLYRKPNGYKQCLCLRREVLVVSPPYRLVKYNHVTDTVSSEAVRTWAVSSKRPYAVNSVQQTVGRKQFMPVSSPWDTWDVHRYTWPTRHPCSVMGNFGPLLWNWSLTQSYHMWYQPSWVNPGEITYHSW